MREIELEMISLKKKNGEGKKNRNWLVGRSGRKAIQT